MSTHVCPECGKKLEWVGSRPYWMNPDQWEDARAGDYFSPCEQATHSNGNCYFWRDGDGGCVKASNATQEAQS